MNTSLQHSTAAAVAEQHPLLDDSVRLEGREPWVLHTFAVLPHVQTSFRCQFKTCHHLVVLLLGYFAFIWLILHV